MAKIQDLLSSWDVKKIRQDFPVLHQQVNGNPLVYLDNAATSQKPKSVIQAISQFYQKNNANVHRGLHYLSEQATSQYESVRKKVADWIHAPSEKNIVFVRGTTEGINLIASGLGQLLQKGDEVLVSQMEHHANIVPWQLLRDQMGLILKVIPMLENGELDMRAYQKLLTPKTKLLSITHASNALGVVNPIKDMIALARANNTSILIDAAQSIVHERLDVQSLGCDFLVFSGHKLFGPTGIGVLYVKEDWLKKLPPYQGGGDMILSVSFDETVYADAPQKFEAGTPNIAGVIGLGAALDYLKKLDWQVMAAYEKSLLSYATESLREIKGLKILADVEHKLPIIAFVLEDIHPHDIATIIDHSGIAVRAGHHCAEPAVRSFGYAASIRASFCFYNTFEEVDLLVKAIQNVKGLFKA
jgi:cysteine desulfurase/selenocysteine lyase